jgi:hypothetical protein
MLYLFFAGLSVIFGTSLATLVRCELSQPGSMIFNNNGGAYHIVVAEHALLMVFFVVTPIIFGGFGNYFLPVQVGARDVAYPRLNNFSVWLLPAGLISSLRALWDGISMLPIRLTSGKQFNYTTWRSRERNWEDFIIEGAREEKLPYSIIDFNNDMPSFVYVLGRADRSRLISDDLTS